MARERFVPTPQQVEEGADGGITRGRRGPFKKLREALAPKRVAKHDVRVEGGVGEARVMMPAPRIEPIRFEAPAPEPATQPMASRSQPEPQPEPGATKKPAKPAPPVSPPQQRRARRTRVEEGVLPVAPVGDAADPDARVGSWEPGLSMDEMHRRIGSVQRYGEDT